MAIILKISVRFTLKELRCEFSSSFDIISSSEEEVFFFANSDYVWNEIIIIIIIIIIIKIIIIMRVKENIGYRIFFTHENKKNHSRI